MVVNVMSTLFNYPLNLPLQFNHLAIRECSYLRYYTHNSENNLNCDSLYINLFQNGTISIISSILNLLNRFCTPPNTVGPPVPAYESNRLKML